MRAVKPRVLVATDEPSRHPAAQVVTDLVASLRELGATETSVPRRLGRIAAKTGWRVSSSAGRTPVVVPMMGARFDLLYGASLRGVPVPYAWDVWEQSWPAWSSAITRLRLPLVAVTSRVSAAALQELVPESRIVCVPEATRLARYRPGPPLTRRTIDVLELGRRHSSWHASVVHEARKAGLVHMYESKPGNLIFPTTDAMITGFANSKVSVCFPSSTTHPGRSGRVTTMTHRYLESVASRCVIVGEPVPELVDLLTFDPVVKVRPDDPWGQLSDLVSRIDEHQEIVDRAHRALLGSGDWNGRATTLMSHIAGTFNAA